jgi:hypothetical protein
MAPSWRYASLPDAALLCARHVRLRSRVARHARWSSLERLSPGEELRMSEVARSAGVSRESLYRALSAQGNPELGTVLRVLAVFKMRLSAVPQARRPPQRASVRAAKPSRIARKPALARTPKSP